MKGHFDKAGVSCKRFVREFKLDGAEEMALGQEIKCDVFEAGDKIVTLLQISKGKGFQGAIKRHGQSRGPMLTVLNIIVMQVPTVQHQIRVKYSRAKRCRARWEM